MCQLLAHPRACVYFRCCFAVLSPFCPVHYVVFEVQASMHSPFMPFETCVMITCVVTLLLMSIATSKSGGYTSLQISAVDQPVDGNKDGSYLTMWSPDGLMYGLVMMASSPGAVLADQTMWQVRPRAAGPVLVVYYMVLAFVYMGIPSRSGSNVCSHHACM